MLQRKYIFQKCKPLPHSVDGRLQKNGEKQMQSLYGGVSALSSFTSCNKNDTQDPVWKQTYLQAIGPTTR